MAIALRTIVYEIEPYHDFKRRGAFARPFASDDEMSLDACYQLKCVGLYVNRQTSGGNPLRIPYSLTTHLPALTLLTFIGLLLLGGGSAAPQSCILCDKDDLKAKDPRHNYEEFLFEHQVTRHDAINALKALNESFYEGVIPDNACTAVRCTGKVMKYCLGPQFINDHCWCELGHNVEGLPFVPHICYVGEKVYKASVGSCFFYEEVKECCCATALARQWRHISAAGSLYTNTVQLPLIGVTVLLVPIIRLLLKEMLMLETM